MTRLEKVAATRLDEVKKNNMAQTMIKLNKRAIGNIPISLGLLETNIKSFSYKPKLKNKVKKVKNDFLTTNLAQCSVSLLVYEERDKSE